jgi:hypothetical protein
MNQKGIFTDSNLKNYYFNGSFLIFKIQLQEI